MRALIIGGAGFVGQHLINYLKVHTDWKIFVTKIPTENFKFVGIEIHNLNILEISEIDEVLHKIQPDYIFHLAAQSSVAYSWKNPGLTIDVNIKGTVNLLESIRKCSKKPRILLIGSGEEYGFIQDDEVPIKETNATRPGNIYAATKVAQNLIGVIYARSYQMDVIMVRAFNHIGPNQEPYFVVADFCKQVVEIEQALKEPVLSVGNLNAKRDFTDVRDVVRAYVQLVQHGEAGEIYNVGSGLAIEINQILQQILKLSKSKITIKIDSQRMRPSDIPIIEANTEKIFNCIQWKPEISLEQTLEETLNYWRKRIEQQVDDEKIS